MQLRLEDSLVECCISDVLKPAVSHDLIRDCTSRDKFHVGVGSLGLPHGQLNHPNLPSSRLPHMQLEGELGHFKKR